MAEVRNMRAFLDENPDVKVVTLFPNDGNWFCEYPRCADIAQMR